MPAQIIRRNEPAKIPNAGFKGVDCSGCALPEVDRGDSLNSLVELLPHAHHPQGIQTVHKRSSPTRELVHIISAYGFERIFHPCLGFVASPALLEDTFHLQASLFLDCSDICG